MKRIPIGDDEAQSLGIFTRHERLEGNEYVEYRYRLLSGTGGAYIRTESGNRGGWQEAHYHDCVMETYIVHRGYMYFADKVDGKTRFRRIRENEIVTTKPKVPHNVYLPANSVIHTVKYGDRNENPNKPDRIPDTKFTEETRLSEEEVVARLEAN